MSEDNRGQINRGTKISIKQSFDRQNGYMRNSCKLIYGQDVDQVSKSHPTTYHQLNLPVKEKIFKDLIPVNVNDSILEEIYPKKQKQRGHTQPDKDPEPVLGDYLSPIKPLELKIESCDYSAITAKKTETFNYHRLYDLFKALNVDS